MKKNKYQGLLTEVLETIRQSRGDNEAQRIFAECKSEGQDAMSREVVLLIAARYLQGMTKLKFLIAHPFLVFPVLIRILSGKPDHSGPDQ